MSATANRWSLLRDNLIVALKALPFPDYVVIDKISRPAGVDAMPGLCAIGVCHAGDRWTTPPELAYHLNQPAVMIFQIVIRADSAMNSTDALDAVGAIEDLSAIALQVRNVDIGIYGMGDDLPDSDSR